ncbi:MAG: GTP-binding protein, partial [Parvibaculum sp.]|nr:GTP-binding protein [Parvibaculum sp.]
SDAALLIIDAAEGVREQSRRHGYLLHLLGIRQVAVAVNKMDLINYEKDQFDLIEQEYRDYLTSIGVTPTFVIPVSARQGDNIVNQTGAMPWYKGPTVVKALDSFMPSASPVDRPLRFPVQDVYKFDHRRIIAGRVEEGRFSIGDELVFSPSNKTARVKSIEYWSTVPGKKAPTEAVAGESVGITLDEQIFVERGELISHVDHPPIETDVFRARIFWLGHEPLVKGKSYRIKLGTLEAPVTVQSIESIVDTSDLSNSSSHQVERNQVAEIVIRARRMLALDEFTKAPKSGRFVLIDKYDIAGGGIISMEGYADQRDLITSRSTNITRVEHGITNEARAFRNGHKGGVLWFTGLSGAGKSTLA